MYKVWVQRGLPMSTRHSYIGETAFNGSAIIIDSDKVLERSFTPFFKRLRWYYA